MIIEEIESVNQVIADGYGQHNGFGEACGTEWGCTYGENIGYGNGTGVGYGFLKGGGFGSTGDVNKPEFD